MEEMTPGNKNSRMYPRLISLSRENMRSEKSLVSTGGGYPNVHLGTCPGTVDLCHPVFQPCTP
jgi:hypothetical protein